MSDQTAIAGRSFIYQVPEVIDPDGDSLTYNVSLGAGFNPLPSWLRFNADTRTFTGRQRASHIGEYTIRVAVDDGSLESWANFTLTVVEAPPNQPPIAPSLTDQTAVEDQTLHLRPCRHSPTRTRTPSPTRQGCPTAAHLPGVAHASTSGNAHLHAARRWRPTLRPRSPYRLPPATGRNRPAPPSP